MCFTEGFAAVFKVTDVVAMPHDTERVCLIKANQYLSFTA